MSPIHLEHPVERNKLMTFVYSIQNMYALHIVAVSIQAQFIGSAKVSNAFLGDAINMYLS